MPRYAFQRPARAVLLDQLVAAGLDPQTVDVQMLGGQCWVTCDEADFDTAASVVAAHDAASIDAVQAQAATDDRTDRASAKQAIAVLLTDAARLEDNAQPLTVQQLRNHLARTNRALAAVLRYLARRGL